MRVLEIHIWDDLLIWFHKYQVFVQFKAVFLGFYLQ